MSIPDAELLIALHNIDRRNDKATLKAVSDRYWFIISLWSTFCEFIERDKHPRLHAVHGYVHH